MNIICLLNHYKHVGIDSTSINYIDGMQKTINGSVPIFL